MAQRSVFTVGGVIFAIVLFFYLVPTGTPKVTYWVVTGGGTAISMLIGWWLSRRIGNDTLLPSVSSVEAGAGAGADTAVESTQAS